MTVSKANGLLEEEGLGVRRLGIEDEEALTQFRRVLAEAVRPEGWIA